MDGCISHIRVSFREMNQLIGATITYKYPTKGDAAYTYITSLCQQFAGWRAADPDSVQALSFEEFPIIAPILREEVIVPRDNGAPTDYIQPPHEWTSYHGAYLMLKPPHPNATKLYIN